MGDGETLAEGTGKLSRMVNHNMENAFGSSRTWNRANEDEVALRLAVLDKLPTYTRVYWMVDFMSGRFLQQYAKYIQRVSTRNVGSTKSLHHDYFPGKQQLMLCSKNMVKKDKEEKLALQKARELDAFDQKNHGALHQYSDKNYNRDKNGFHGANSVKATLFGEEALRTMKAFWLPSATPEAPSKVEAPSTCITEQKKATSKGNIIVFTLVDVIVYLF